MRKRNLRVEPVDRLDAFSAHLGRPACAGLGHQRWAAEFVAHDRDRGLAVDDPLGHRVAVRAGERGGHVVSVTR